MNYALMSGVGILLLVSVFVILPILLILAGIRKHDKGSKARIILITLGIVLALVVPIVLVYSFILVPQFNFPYPVHDH